MDHFQWKSTFLIIIANNKPSKGPIDCAAIITSCCTKLSLFSRDAFLNDSVMPSVTNQLDPWTTKLTLFQRCYSWCCFFTSIMPSVGLTWPLEDLETSARWNNVAFYPPAPSCNKACLLFSSFRTHFLFVLAAAASEKNSLKQICAVCTFQCYLSSSTR